MKKNFTQKGQAKLLSKILQREEFACCVPNPVGGGGGGSDFLLHIQDTTTVDLSGNGTLSTPLTATVKVSSHSNNILTVQTDGLYVGAPDFSLFARNGTNILTGKVEWGGPLLHNTNINQSNKDINFFNGNVGFRTQNSPARTVSIGDDIIGTPRMFFYAPDGQTTIWETSASANACINSHAGVYLRPDYGSAAGSVVISSYNTNGIVSDYTSGGADILGRIGLQIPLEPGVSNEFFVKPVRGASTPLIETYLSLYGPAKFKNIPQNDVAPKVLALDVDENVRFISAAVLGGESGTAIQAFTFSGTGAGTSFLIPHGLGGTPKVLVTPGSADAAGITHVTVDGTNITIHYSVAPSLGTNNGTIYWKANL